MPQPDRNLESQKHRETPEAGERMEVLEALKRNLTTEEYAAFSDAIAPGITYEERMNRLNAFNVLEAGTTDGIEPIEGAAHDAVSINFAGTEILVSRSARGTFTLATNLS